LGALAVAAGILAYFLWFRDNPEASAEIPLAYELREGAYEDREAAKDPVLRKLRLMQGPLAQAPKKTEEKPVPVEVTPPKITRPTPKPVPPPVKVVERPLGSLELEKAMIEKRRKQAEEAKREAVLENLIFKGKTALQNRQLDVAIQAFAEARRLAPNNSEADRGLKKATQAREERLALERQQAEKDRLRREEDARLEKARLEREAKVKQELAQLKAKEKEKKPPVVIAPEPVRDRKKDIAYMEAMDAGRLAMAKGNFAAAIEAFDRALSARPNDADASARLAQARSKALAREDDPALREGLVEDPKSKNAAAFKDLLAKGQAALVRRDFVRAIGLLKEAGRLRPGDRTVADLLLQADQGKKAEAARIAQARKEAENLNRTKHEPKPDPKPVVVTEKPNPKREIPKETEAERIAREKAAAERARLEEQKAREDERRRKKLAFLEALNQGQVALGKGNLDAAIAAFTRARDLSPDDPEARTALEKALQERQRRNSKLSQEEQDKLLAAQRAKELEAAQKKAADEARQKEEQARQKREREERERQARYLVVKARDALRAKKLAEAEATLDQARKLAPDLPEIAALARELSEARRLAQIALDKANKEALKLIPLDNKDADPRYLKHMKSGRDHLQAGRRTEAIRAFEAALRIVPNDPAATAWLKQARK
jgi:tetratricopeptide (TPR) repeat protein